MSQQPNILLITADQWRGDCLSLLGHPQVRTPNIDRLANQGVVFAKHYTPCVPCSPARASLFTGLNQSNHGVTHNGAPLDNRFDNLALAARRAGYLPTLFGYTDTALDPSVLHPNDPDNMGYEQVLPGFFPRVILREDDKSWLSWLLAQGIEIGDPKTIHCVAAEAHERIPLKPPRYSRQHTQTAFLTDEFLRWHWEQKWEQERPWFAHISYLRPHPPFVVPEPFNQLFDPNDGPDFASFAQADIQESKQKLAHFIPHAAGYVQDLSQHDFRRIRALYYGMIAEVDAQLGRLFDELDARDDFERTLIIFTSDHGEMMGDHRLLGKVNPHRQSYHIPLVIKPVDQTPTSRINAPTSSIDIFPTLCHYLQVQPNNHVDGLALTPFLRGDTPTNWRDTASYEFRGQWITVS